MKRNSYKVEHKSEWASKWLKMKHKLKAATIRSIRFTDDVTAKQIEKFMLEWSKRNEKR